MPSGKSSRSSAQVGLYGWTCAYAPQHTDGGKYPVLPKFRRDRVGRSTIRYFIEVDWKPCTKMYRAVAEDVPQLRKLTIRQYGRWYVNSVRLFASAGHPPTSEFQNWELKHLPLLMELTARKMNPAVACAVSVRHPKVAAQVADELLESAWRKVEYTGEYLEWLFASELLAGLPERKIGEKVREDVIVRGLSHHRSEVRERALRLLEFVEGGKEDAVL